VSAAVRTALAEAANGVLGGPRKCSTYYRSTTKPGDAWVSFARMDRDDTSFGFMEAWEVRVVLAQDLATAEKWADENSAALVDALSEHMTITAVVMVTLAMDTGNIPGLVVEGVRPN
jgi:hypothetical protein